MKGWLFALGVPFVVVAIAIAFTACGGSSSETPFPLEPDSRFLADGGPPSNARYVVFTGGKRDGGRDAKKSSEDEGEEEEGE